MFKVGDRVKCVDPPHPKFQGKFAIIRKVEEDWGGVYVTWKGWGTLWGVRGPYMAGRFELVSPLLTPFEQRVQAYIRQELQR